MSRLVRQSSVVLCGTAELEKEREEKENAKNLFLAGMKEIVENLSTVSAMPLLRRALLV